METGRFTLFWWHFPTVEGCGFRVYAGSMRDYLTTRRNKTSHMRLYTNVPRKKAAPSRNRVIITQRLLRVGLRMVVHPQKNSFLCSSLRVGAVLESVRVTGGMNTSNIMLNYLAPSKRISVPLVGRLMTTTSKLSIAFRQTFSMYHGPRGTLRRVVRSNYGHVLASKRRTATRTKVPLLGRLRERTTKQVVLLTNYNMGRGGVTHVTSRAKVRRFRFSTQRAIVDSVRCQGPTISVKKAMRVSRCAGRVAATREIRGAVGTIVDS